MTAAVAAFGWAAAAGALALALAARRELDARMERLARASHELRRPLTAARLAAHGLAGANGDRRARAAAIERELARAGRLLGDLDAVRGAAAPVWPGESRPVALDELLAEVAAAWEPVAAAQGRFVRVEAEPGPTRSCAATRSGWRRRWATSSPTRSSTARERCAWASADAPTA